MGLSEAIPICFQCPVARSLQGSRLPWLLGGHILSALGGGLQKEHTHLFGIGAHRLAAGLVELT